MKVKRNRKIRIISFMLLITILVNTFDMPGTYKQAMAATECYVYFDANGGSGGPQKQEIEFGKEIQLTTNEPTRTGYTFLGWSLFSNATVAAFKGGDILSVSASFTLYAVWKINTYSIKYNANGGSGILSQQTKEYGETISLSKTIPTRTGYEFLGWSTSSIATTATYQPGSEYSGNSNLTLFAVWKANKYSIEYDANGGSGAPATQTKEHGKNIILSSIEPVRTGYEFLGWSTNSNATIATYKSGSEYSGNSNITLYAVWKVITYSIRYDANGGSGAPATQKKEHGKSILLSSIEPVRTGYNFLGWSKSETATYASYRPGAEYYTNEDTKLYAVWDIKKFTITYYDNGGTGAPSTQTKEYGKSIFLSKTVPMRTGYTFLGWSTDPSATTATYITGSEYAKNSDLSLYAVWKIITYSIQYDANGGDGAPANQTKTYGIDVSISAKVPTRTGYNFMGWSTSANSTIIAYKGGDAYTANQSVTLYAVWSKKQYAISYFANGGSGAPRTQTKEHDQSISLSYTKPTREGYYFIKWCETSDGNGTSYDPGDYFDGNQSVTLYAIWGKKKKSVLKTKKTTYQVSHDSPGFDIEYRDITGDGNITYSSNKNKVASVDSFGYVSIGDYGEAKIRITIAETEKYYSKSIYVTVKVIPAKISGFNVSKKNNYLYIGWDADTTIDGYQLQYGKSLSTKKKHKTRNYTKNSKQGKLIHSGKKIIGSKSNLVPGVNSFRVRSYKKVGKKKYYSAWSKIIKIKI